MMKTWNRADIKELNIHATAQNPTTEMSADDFQNGYFKQGVGNASGSKIEIPYYPE